MINVGDCGNINVRKIMWVMVAFKLDIMKCNRGLQTAIYIDIREYVAHMSTKGMAAGQESFN